MARSIKIISADLDGKQLRKERTLYPNHIRCQGKDDTGDVTEVLRSVHNSNLFSIPSEKWEEIFGGKK